VISSSLFAQQAELDRPETRVSGVQTIANPPPAPLVGGSDSCTTPDPIMGTGSFAFDTNASTVGTEGQSTVNCIFRNMIGIDKDVWFVWTAPSNGTFVISTCGATTVDTKISVYSSPTGGPYCPAPGISSLACHDDISDAFPQNRQTRVSFVATVGNEYVIQVGTFPGAVGGTGNIDISLYTPNATCQYDDGTTEQAVSYGTAGTSRAVAWMHRMGAVGSTTNLTTVSSAWGWTGTTSPLPAGLTVSVGVWDDPNDDGVPTDGVLLGQASAPMVGQHTNALQPIALPAPVTVNGVFFIGAWVTFTTGFPVPIDANGCGGDIAITSWVSIASSGVFDPVNLPANSTPPFRANTGNGSLGYLFLLRADCTSGPGGTGTVFCPGDGTGTACPCGNSSPAGAGEGCLSSLNVGGKVRGVGVASLANDSLTLHGTQMPNSSCLYFQGTTQQSAGAGAAFGDGKRCAGGAVIRLGTKINAAGVSSYPVAGDASISVKGAVGAPGTRTYQAWYRNAAAFCTSSTFNLTNGLEVIWGA
jgi:hypothetical protein